MVEQVTPEFELLVKGIRFFTQEFGGKPEVAACGPGRVNLIGEHTDYNDGFVLPMALPLLTILVGKKNDLQRCRIITSLSGEVDKPSFTEFSVGPDAVIEVGQPQWANYVKGVVALFPGAPVPGFDAVIVSTVPVGGGLSSSAALEVSTYTFLEVLTDCFTPRPTDKALICQKAEHEFAGVPCGIMDQFVSTMGKSGNALLIDCRSMVSELVPIPDDTTFLVINSNVKHELASGEYAKRRNECQEAARVLGVESLRLAKLSDLTAMKEQKRIDDVAYRRAHHVITEIQRTQQAALCLSSGETQKFGELMYDSHYSLSKDYEVSCAELDDLVAIAKKVPGVLGSRMTGGGFGGCTVTLLTQYAVKDLINAVLMEYKGKPTFYTARPSHAARIYSMEGFITI